jgi:hypothetical protein
MLNLLRITDFWGIGLLIIRFLDGYKYYIESVALKKAGLAKGRSRRFINYAWISDAYTILYILTHKIDWYLIVCFIIALIFMSEYWYTLYLTYPYKKRGLNNFKRPNIFVYLMNSLTPNKLRKKL